jgi:hypothetical protein
MILGRMIGKRESACFDDDGEPIPRKKMTAPSNFTD